MFGREFANYRRLSYDGSLAVEISTDRMRKRRLCLTMVQQQAPAWRRSFYPQQGDWPATCSLTTCRWPLLIVQRQPLDSKFTMKYRTNCCRRKKQKRCWRL